MDIVCTVNGDVKPIPSPHSGQSPLARDHGPSLTERMVLDGLSTHLHMTYPANRPRWAADVSRDEVRYGIPCCKIKIYIRGMEISSEGLIIHILSPGRYSGAVDLDPNRKGDAAARWPGWTASQLV